MRKLIPFILLLPIFAAACNMPSADPAATEDAAAPDTAAQFTAVPSLTAEVPSSAEQTQAPPASSPAAQVSGPQNAIQFAAGGTFADVTDSIPEGESKTYSVNAMKGQVMSISVLPQIPDGGWGYLSIKIKGADGSLLCPQAPETECLYWRGKLPASQDYLVSLTPNGDVPEFVMRVAINPPGKDAQYFQYDNPLTGVSLTYPDSFAPAKPVYGNYKISPELSLHLIDSKTYAKTNLSEVYLFVSSSSDPAIVSGCTDPNESAGGPEEIVDNQAVNGLTFVHSTSSGAGAGNYYDQEVYRMVKDQVCREVIFFIHYNAAGNYPPGSITEFDRDAILQALSDIFSTYTIH